MNDNTSEIEKEYIEFCNNVDKAIAECNRDASVSNGNIDKIKESLISLCLALNHPPSLDYFTSKIEQMQDKINHFNTITGVKFNGLELIKDYCNTYSINSNDQKKEVETASSLNTNKSIS